MIRRDYILRQIEQFVAMLAKLTGLTNEERWQEASTTVAGEFQRLTGADGPRMLRMTGTELLAALARDVPTQVVESRAFMLTTVCKANGDVLAGQGQSEESRQYYLKGLQLLLETFGRNEIADRPDFVPAVEAFLAGLGDAPLSLPMSAMLLRHYEQTREFAKAEDILFGMLEAAPANADVLDFGAAFYRRLLALGDDASAAGGLPRAEVEAGLAELEKRGAHLRPANQ